MVHDPRAGSDLLYHQFWLKLINVFNTMAGHILVTNWMVAVEKEVTWAKRLCCLVLDYLGVVGPHLPGPCHLDTWTEEEQHILTQTTVNRQSMQSCQTCGECSVD